MGEYVVRFSFRRPVFYDGERSYGSVLITADSEPEAYVKAFESLNTSKTFKDLEVEVESVKVATQEDFAQFKEPEDA